MPIYEYRCGACGFEKEYLQKRSDAPIIDCPSCGKPEMVKLVSAAGFQLKGSGWYATDFKNSGSKPAEKKPEKQAEDKSDAAKSSEAAPAAGKGDASSASSSADATA